MAKVSYEVLQGKISNVTSGNSLVNTANVVGVKNAWTFRVNNRAASFKTPHSISFSEDDVITAVGVNRMDAFHVAAIRNETTGASYEPPISTMAYVVGGVLIVIGLPFLFSMLFIFGLLFIVGGWYYIQVARKTKEAIEILHQTPKYTGA